MAFVTATVLGYAALAASLAGTGLAAYGQMQQAKTATNTANYNAKLQENQAIQADMEARENARRTREKNLLFAGTQRAAIAASGAAFEGSPLEVLAYSAGKFELEAQDEARAARARYALGFNRAGETRLEGEAQAGAYQTAAAGTILSGASSFAGQYGDLKYQGAI